MTGYSRARKDPLVEWWLTIDRPLLILVVTLAAVGLLLSPAASVPMADRYGLPPYHFFYRHLMFLVLSIAGMVLLSVLSLRQIRLLAIAGFGMGLLGLVATLFLAEETKGALRWIRVGPFSVQVSEFVKPLFVVTVAWLLAQGIRRPGFQGRMFAFALLGMTAALLLAQPDLGQTVLITAVFGVVLFVSGLSWKWISMLAAAGIALVVAAYAIFPHVSERIDAFLAPEENDTFQVERAYDAIRTGGLFGQGPGEGYVKRQIPDAHTDFVFAVIAEEYGLIACMGVILLILALVVRGLTRAMEETDAFIQMAVSGLICLVGFQAAINLGVNLQLLPAKGMTLPFISYGGSSMLALGLTIGLILALTRRRPGRGFARRMGAHGFQGVPA